MKQGQRFFLASILIGLVCMLSSCTNKPGKVIDTNTSGSIKIAVDNTYEPIIREELTIFAVDYPDTHIKPVFKSENEVLTLLFKDSVRLIIAGRKLTAPELKPFESRKIDVHQNIVAKDAIALIVNPANMDTTMEMGDVLKIFNGTFQKWEDHKSGSVKGDINIVLDNNGSSTGHYIKELAGSNALTGKNVYALEKNTEVISYVSTHKNALGIIGVNWISNTSDSVANSFTKKIRVVAVAPSRGEKGAGEYYKPFQAYIAEGQYPMTRNMYAISAEGYSGLGTGFAVFVNSDKGQRIILKAGLVPVNGVVRIVEMK